MANRVGVSSGSDAIPAPLEGQETARLEVVEIWSLIASSEGPEGLERLASSVDRGSTHSLPLVVNPLNEHTAVDVDLSDIESSDSDVGGDTVTAVALFTRLV